MSRAIRTAVLLSAVAALTLLSAVGGGGVPLLPLALTCGMVTAALALISRAAAAAVALGLVYLVPVLFLVTVGRNQPAFVAVWCAGLLGLIVSESWRSGWSLPARWQWPLACWALVVALSWPVVAWRELDFTWPLVWDHRLPVSGARIGAPAAVSWVAYTAVTHLLGILWLDWLFFIRSRVPWPLLRQQIIAPLVIGVLTACAVAVYQGFVDIDALSGHAWPSLHRAPGTLMDANVFGMVAALWGPAFLVLGFSSRRTSVQAASVFALVLTWIGVWVSGSRTAALTAVLGMLLALPAFFRLLPAGRIRIRVAAAMAVAALLLGIVLTTLPSITRSAIERGRYLVPDLSIASLRQTASVLWEREGYGTASVAMIREFPWFGVGLGSYNTLSHDYALETAGLDIPPDNAQNWFRHQVAELGLVGSIGWIWWVLLFLAALWGRPVSHAPGPGSALRGPITAFGLASLVGMPGQDPAVVITFLMLVFWYAADLGLPAPAGRRLWVGLLVVWGLAVVCAAGVFTRPELRPPFRAARFDFMYSYGFFRDPDVTWSAGRGVTAEPVAGPWLRLTAWAAQAAQAGPVDADVWVDGAHVVNQKLRGSAPVTTLVKVPEGRRRVVIEARVDRTFRPADRGLPDRRALGLAMRWRFVSEAHR